jgi:hypothetical protein
MKTLETLRKRKAELQSILNDSDISRASKRAASNKIVQINKAIKKATE